jgi:hypothetical protein
MPIPSNHGASPNTWWMDYVYYERSVPLESNTCNRISEKVWAAYCTVSQSPLKNRQNSKEKLLAISVTKIFKS